MVVIRRLWPLAAVIVVLAVAVAAVLLAHAPQPPLATRVDQVARTLRCPTCQGESVAASDTPIARSMRAEIAHQLRAGRSPDEVRSWFVDRYGADIVTTPSARGPGLLLWLLPLGVLALGAGLVVARTRSRQDRPPVEEGQPPVAGRAIGRGRLLVAGSVCLAAGVAVPAAVGFAGDGGADATSASPATGSAGVSAASWVGVGRSLDRRGDTAGAVRAYRRALSRRPADAAARTRLAFDLLRISRLARAEGLVRPVSARPGRYRALALLVLGLAQRGRHEPAFRSTLRRFLRVAPHHPAAAQVRRLLRSASR
jgi:cytochrome c-type biogenesis protein CcmH/NrfF